MARLTFTKMQGAGNDFVVLDATRAPITLSPAQVRHLGDRRFGIGCDQILLIEPGDGADIDFRYRIFNNSGDEVEHCGNGARCFVRYVHDHGLSTRRTLRVATINNRLELTLGDDGQVRVDMNRPFFGLADIPFDAGAAAGAPRTEGQGQLWPLALPGGGRVDVAVLSMGNPHAVQRVADAAAADVAGVGRLVEHHPAFPRRVNAGFMEVKARDHIVLRVWERDAGETLACGTGACAAVVAGIRLGWLDRSVRVSALGGDLHVDWPADDATVRMAGPAETVFEGEIEL
ncbi:MAG: diaminopimelate epimerase [Aquabacterium sp.]